ncbi:hypothetical protein Z517_10316 [Fonsecaea pedrosoi CBS 271.37]|uniref:Uncharacterized protein n=1 Tax=Fonsecaea pedrosoi CBS 271.37 TaxID=1442368 RepID=A0A0D2GT33_9EURO|nr:uncharacterized protein Z517_10316 [Fonsecaea pedrosoi CBS 271.37]KIW75574.1 hypothetical protein Z517_10316 [Fonsecaea pedrosoi CBS 271.37]
MQVAAFLSDLKSLSVCSHEAAIALVKPPTTTTTKTKTTDDGALQTSSTKSDETSGQPAQSLPKDQDDKDLHRADELVSLYYDVKVKFTERGPDPDFVQAGREVDQVLAALSRSDR